MNWMQLGIYYRKCWGQFTILTKKYICILLMTKACMALLERNFRGYLSVLTAICFAKYLNYISLIITLNIIMLKNLYIFSFQLMALVGDPPDRICLWQRNLASRNYTESKDVNKEVSLVLVCAQYFKIHQMIKKKLVKSFFTE